MYYFFSLCIGFLLGIVMSAFVLADSVMIFLIALTVALLLDAFLFERDVVRKVTIIVSFLCMGIFFGQLRVVAFHHFISHDLDRFDSNNVSIVGKIISEPISDGETQKFTFSTSNISVASSTQHVTGNVSVTTELFPRYHYGDVVSIFGVLKKPEKVVEIDGRVFDYPAYLLKDSVTHTISFGTVKSLDKNEGNRVVKFLYDIKENFVYSMQTVLPEPEAGLLAGIVLGTQTLSKNISNDFRVAGLSHIVVLSGYNITIVADFMMAFALFFAPAYAAFVAVFSVTLFVLMAGAGASAVRAGIMAIVALLGKRFGKSYDAGRALFFAAFLMVVWNPETFLHDPSFHLSFLATLAMIYFSPIVFNHLTFITEKYGMRETLATTLGVNLFVLPYILYMAGSIQIFSLPANMLVLPFVSLTMFLGFLTALFGFVSYYPGLIFGLPSYAIVRYDIFIAQTISHLPFAQVSIPDFSVWMMCVIYFIFGWFLYKKNHAVEQSSPHGLLSQIVTSDGYTVID
jgi:competence protein ComEC